MKCAAVLYRLDKELEDVMIGWVISMMRCVAVLYRLDNTNGVFRIQT